MTYLEMLGFEIPLDAWVWATALLGLTGLWVGWRSSDVTRVGLFGAATLLAGLLGIVRGGVEGLGLWASGGTTSATASAAFAERVATTLTLSLAFTLSMVLMVIARRTAQAMLPRPSHSRE